MKSSGKRALVGVCGCIALLIAPTLSHASRIPSRQVKEVFFGDNDPHIPDYYDPTKAYADRENAVVDTREPAAPNPVVREAARHEKNWFLRFVRLLHSLRMRGLLR